MASGEILNIRSNKLIDQVMVLDMQGKVLFQANVPYADKEVAITNIPSMNTGMYIVRIVSNDNSIEIKKLSILND